MSWVSGVPTRCLWCKAPRAVLTLRQERYDVIEQVFTGAAVCGHCQETTLYSRRPSPEERRTHMPGTRNITQERAARRFHQITVLERQIAGVAIDLVSAQAHVKELKEQHDGLLARLRTAARDEGELPLFDLDGDD